MFAAGLGAATVAGGALADWLYDITTGTLVAALTGIRLCALFAVFVSRLR